MMLEDVLRDNKLTAAELARRVDCDKSYLSHVLARRKPLTRRVAVKIFRATGAKLGPIADATADEIAALERFAA